MSLCVTSRAPELAVEFLTAQEQGRGTAVRAVVGIQSKLAAGDQIGDFLRRQPISRTDGRMAGHQAHQIVQKHFPRRRPFLRNQVIDNHLKD